MPRFALAACALSASLSIAAAAADAETIDTPDAAASPTPGATVTITVENVRSDNGRLLVSLCAEADYMNWPKCAGARPYAKTGAIEVVFEDVAPGRYGVSAFHDANMNGRLDMQWYGPPAEPTGASNDPKPRMGPPLFEDIAFDVGATPVAISLRLGSGRVN